MSSNSSPSTPADYHALFDLAKAERLAHAEVVAAYKRRGNLRQRWIAEARRIAGRHFVPMPWGVQGVPGNIIKLKAGKVHDNHYATGRLGNTESGC